MLGAEQGSVWQGWLWRCFWERLRRPPGPGAVVVPLDGTWAVADSVAADAIPASFDHAVAVPGLTNQAKPHFADVDQFETFEYVENRKQLGRVAARREMRETGTHAAEAELFLVRADLQRAGEEGFRRAGGRQGQFGTAVWLNGKKIGEHLGCFTAGRFDVAGQSTGKARTDW